MFAVTPKPVPLTNHNTNNSFERHRTAPDMFPVVILLPAAVLILYEVQGIYKGKIMEVVHYPLPCEGVLVQQKQSRIC